MITINAGKTEILQGEQTAINWSTTEDVISCTATGGWNGYKTKAGTEKVSPITTTGYRLYCGNSIADVSIKVLPVKQTYNYFALLPAVIIAIAIYLGYHFYNKRRTNNV